MRAKLINTISSIVQCTSLFVTGLSLPSEHIGLGGVQLTYHATHASDTGPTLEDMISNCGHDEVERSDYRGEKTAHRISSRGNSQPHLCLYQVPTLTLKIEEIVKNCAHEAIMCRFHCILLSE
ncbi:hypothetical protein F5880DRAFT_495752 [Lentinula raphanica]|nr:hypothetical protein F5880DRAFT_495752 [Lentinula raphanica]